MNRPLKPTSSARNSLTNARHASLRVRPYHPENDAPVIFGWIKSKEELLHVAPSTQGPLTVEQIRNWVRPGGHGYVLLSDKVHDDKPISYGEVMPLQNQSSHRWLGHVIIDPSLRGRGLGAEWTRRLIQLAFTDPNVVNVSLVVFPDNPAAIAAYQRAGMKITGYETHRFGLPQKVYKLVRLEITRA